MKVVLAVVVRDEADLIDEYVAFHLNAGVDLVIATDHRSVDGTTEILESYARDGYVHLIREESDQIVQDQWMTRMARLAATEHRADWVLNSDADEFWWPRGGSLKDVLGSVPPRYGLVRAISHVFVPRPGGGSFAERMTARFSSPIPINDPASTFRPVAKVAHRADERAFVIWGNHDVTGLALARLRSWYPIELLHFPLRSEAQCARKFEIKFTPPGETVRGDLARATRIAAEKEAGSYWERIEVDDRLLERGLAAGALVEDARLRDALRVLRDGDGGLRRPSAARGPGLQFDPPPVAEDAAYASELLGIADADVVRLRRQIDELTARVATLESRGRRGR